MMLLPLWIGGWVWALSQWGSPLAVEHFSAERLADGVQIEWQLAEETSEMRFLLCKRCADDAQFAPIADLSASGQGRYAFTDHQPPPQEAHYRLTVRTPQREQHFFTELPTASSPWQRAWSSIRQMFQAP